MYPHETVCARTLCPLYTYPPVPTFDFGMHPFDSDEHSWFEDHYTWIGELVIRDEIVDDVRIYVGDLPSRADEAYGTGGVMWARGDTWLPILSTIQIHSSALNWRLEEVALHEIAHALGFGTIWFDLDLVGDGPDSGLTNPDPHFTGFLARSAFNLSGGVSYTGKKVPTDSHYSHWRESVFGNELMSPFFGNTSQPLSSVTIQSLADLGYGTTAVHADAYDLPPASKVVAVPTAGICAARVREVGIAPR